MTAHQMLAKVRDLPPISRAALELGNLLGRPDTSNDEVVRVLKLDSVLTAKVLRVCNSPALGLRERVASVDQAVFILGHMRISQMATALAFRSSLSTPLPGYALAAEDLWRHSLLAATVAQTAVTGGLVFEADSSVAFTAGLLHDVGKLIINEFLTRQSSLCIRHEMTEGRTLVEAEREVLGTDHSEVGAAMLYVWRLPDPIIEAVGLHHQPVLQPQPRLSTLTNFADTVAHRTANLRAGQNAQPADLDLLPLKALGLGPEQLEPLLQRFRECPTAADELLALSA